MSAELLVLRLIHVLGGAFWLGAGVFMVVFLVPSLAGAGPAAGKLFAELTRRRFFSVLPLVALLTMLSGLRLLAIVSTGFSPAYFGTRSGLAYAIAGGAAILAFLLSMFFSRPASARAAQLGARLAGASETERAALGAEIEVLRRRGALWGGIAVALLVIAGAGMSVARYL